MRRQRNDSTFPIVLRLSFNGSSRSIPTGLFIKPEDWNAKNNSVNLKTKELKIVAERLQELLFAYQQKLLEFQRYKENGASDVQIIKEYLIGKNNRSTTVLDFWNDEIKRLESILNYGNARNYKSALGALKNVMKLNIPFNKVDYSWLLQTESKLKSNEVKLNSIAVYMRTLRAVYNKAINLGVITASEYPFRTFKIKTEKTTPRVISLAEIKTYFDLKLDTNSHLYHPWNYGRLIFLLRGINFADLAILTRENLKHGRLVYRRSKTHKIYSVKLEPLALEIIQNYLSENRITLLPILTNEEFANKACLPDRIGQLRKVCNKWLKSIGNSLKINENLSTYVFRYSWANGAKSLGFSKDLIAEALGHEYGNSVTGIYLNDFDEEKVDAMNLQIITCVTNTM